MLAILLVFMMVFTLIPGTALAEGGEGNTAEKIFAGSVIAAPLHDNSTENPVSDSALYSYYNVTYSQGTAKISALDVKEHMNANGVKGKWIGIGIEIPSGTNYKNIKLGINSADTLEDAQMTSADYTLNEKEYLTLYWKIDRSEPIEKVYVSFDDEDVYKIEVKTLTNCNVYVGDVPYSGTEKFVLGKTYDITAYVCTPDWSVYDDCSWDISYPPAGLGVDKDAPDSTYGYGSSVRFSPTKAGSYQLNLKNTQGVLIKTIELEVVANDLRGLKSGDLDFYCYVSGEHTSEYSMLGNNWYGGNELTATQGESAESLSTQYKYLSACTVVPEGKEYSDMTVNWYYGNTYSATGAGYTKVSTGGKDRGTAGKNNQITFYNGKGSFGDSEWFFFNICPDTTTGGTYYYYVEISDGKNVLSSVTNQAVVSIQIPQGSLEGIQSGDLGFYRDSYGEYSMLGNNWYATNELRAQVGEDAEALRANYRYLSACTTIPAGKEFSEMTVEWYYGKTYSATGEGYTKVSTGGKESGTAGTRNQITYYNGKSQYEDYFFFNIYPDLTKTGTYYYYVEISDGTNKISSVSCQAMAVITEKKQETAPTGDITVSFTLKGYGNFPGISKTSVTVPNGSTVGDVFKKVLDSKGYTYEGLNTGYISTIKSPSGIELSHFDYGSKSGWMYLVNNAAPNYTLNSYVLSGNENIVWYYTTDYTKDPYAIGSMDKTQSSVTTSGTSGSATTTTPTQVTVSGDTAKATIKTENATEAIKQAKEKKSAEIVIEVSNTDIKTAEKVQVELLTATAKEILNATTADLTVKTPIATVTLPRDALKEAVAEAKGTTITIEVAAISKPTDTQKKAAGTNGQIISVTIKSGSTVISTFGGKSLKLKAEVPTKLKGKKIAAIHIAADGTIEQLAGKLIKEGTKEFYEFMTTHLSTFALVDADELGLEVNDEEANIEKVKKLVSDMSLKASSSKTSKKNIKVTLTVNKDTSAAIKEIEDMGYTVKYKYYRSTRKASKYASKLTSKKTSYTNTAGKKGTKYYYKARVQVYDKDGKLVTQTALKQCRYAARMWSK